jgi:hypothetical protein
MINTDSKINACAGGLEAMEHHTAIDFTTEDFRTSFSKCFKHRMKKPKVTN